MVSESGTSSTIYFHGLPGSADELALMKIPCCCAPKVIDPLDFESFDRTNANQVPVTVIGFSLGAFSALKLAAARPQSVARLVLISPAGPLEMGNLLDQMAGAPVFRTAKGSSIAFIILTAIQALAAFAFPRLLLERMFANSCDAEKTILKDPAAAKSLIKGLQHSLWDAAALYRRTVTEYVKPWEFELSKIECPCQIFHGELDDWVPIGMAQALFERLPEGSEFRMEEKLGHYSTLMKILPDVLSSSVGPLQRPV